MKIKKYRLIERCFLVEGRKNTLEVLNSDFDVLSVVGTRQFLEKSDLTGFKGEILEASSSFLVEAGTFQTNEDCIAVVKMREQGPIEVDSETHVFLLDGISDPGNLGTIIRTLDWFGFTQLICSPDTTDFYNPKVINSTMGSFCRVRVEYTDLGELIRRNPRVVYGADMEGENVFKAHVDQPSFIVMGSESHGLRAELEPLITRKLSIPRIGGAESLNVGVATGILASRLVNS